jgi:hypothetical protein
MWGEGLARAETGALIYAARLSRIDAPKRSLATISGNAGTGGMGSRRDRLSGAISRTTRKLG